MKDESKTRPLPAARGSRPAPSPPSSVLRLPSAPPAPRTSSPAPRASRLPFPMVLTAFGLPHVMGYLATRAGEKHPDPIGPIGLMDVAVETGLAGVELPLPAPGSEALDQMREALSERDLLLVADLPPLLDADPDCLRESLKAAAGLGVRVVRSTLSGILCGDRRKLSEGWDERLLAVARRLNDILPCAEELGIAIAMENHQDATSDDLLNLGGMVGNSPSYGVTLDAGNALAVAEDPVEMARRLAPIVRHIHLKDYTMHFAPEGYRLVRCAAGDGVVDFPAILDILAANSSDLLPGIEIAAQATRTIPLLEAGWWACYPDTQATRLVGALRVLWEKGRRPDEPYSSAWERGEDSIAVSAEELRIVRRSIEYFRGVSRR